MTQYFPKVKSVNTITGHDVIRHSFQQTQISLNGTQNYFQPNYDYFKQKMTFKLVNNTCFFSIVDNYIYICKRVKDAADEESKRRMQYNQIGNNEDQDGNPHTHSQTSTTKPEWINFELWDSFRLSSQDLNIASMDILRSSLSYFLILMTTDGWISIFDLHLDLFELGFDEYKKESELYEPHEVLRFKAHNLKEGKNLPLPTVSICPWRSVYGKGGYSLEFFSLGSDCTIFHWGMRFSLINSNIRGHDVANKIFYIDTLGVSWKPLTTSPLYVSSTPFKTFTVQNIIYNLQL